MNRLKSIDTMRGLVMVLMALDHTRHVFSNSEFNPTDLSETTAAYFLTRWITHLCAPTFVFLAGVGAFLTTQRRQLNTGQLSAYLASRGLWLIVLELTLVHFGWTLRWDYHFVLAQVIWALGWSLLILALLVFLPRRAIATLAICVILGHNALDGVQAGENGIGAWLWMILHQPGKFEYAPGYFFIVAYPLIPWFAVMAAGYCLGPVFQKTPRRRKRAMIFLGLAALALFLLLRLCNGYGDPKPWTDQDSAMFTVFSFLNCTKYPPSLLYLLMTLALMFLGLVAFESITVQQWGRPLLVFGHVPLFFYLIHLPIIHLAMLAITYFRGLPVEWLLEGSGRSMMPKIPGTEYGYDLPAVYLIWLAVLVVLYPACATFAGIKQQYPHRTWLQYL